MNSVGFTGTREGMTKKQVEQFLETIRNLFKIKTCRGIPQFHHGDCLGADAQAHVFAQVIGYEMHIHPPTAQSGRALCKGGIYYDPLPYLERDQKIVDYSDVLIATPKQDAEILRSGTWATVRKARKKRIPIYIIYPAGNVVIENQ